MTTYLECSDCAGEAWARYQAKGEKEWERASRVQAIKRQQKLKKQGFVTSWDQEWSEI